MDLSTLPSDPNVGTQSYGRFRCKAYTSLISLTKPVFPLLSHQQPELCLFHFKFWVGFRFWVGIRPTTENPEPVPHFPWLIRCRVAHQALLVSLLEAEFVVVIRAQRVAALDPQFSLPSFSLFLTSNFLLPVLYCFCLIFTPFVRFCYVQVGHFNIESIQKKKKSWSL